MKSKILLVLVILILGGAILIYIYQNQGGYTYITEDGFSKIYYDKSSIERWINEESGDEIIDVWIIKEYINPLGSVYSDKTLWHIDALNNRYKTSDTFAYDINKNPLET